jgi:hypothetical protein
LLHHLLLSPTSRAYIRSASNELTSRWCPLLD